jgi:glycosyltransferase involved in cell wall biosynthesis
MVTDTVLPATGHAATADPTRSLVVPVYKNAENIAALLDAVSGLAHGVDGDLEAVFVVDGSPDDSLARITAGLSDYDFRAQVLVHARNFGSFAAIRTGIEAARGRHIAVMAADLQEPPELVARFFEVLGEDRADLVVGTRESRADGKLSDLASRTYWNLARRLISADLPRGGVDVFACNERVRDGLLQMREQRTSLIGQLYWLGFRREEIPYHRREREAGESGWTFRRKLSYLTDSFFSFTDLPIRVLTWFGFVGFVAAVLLTLLVVLGRAFGVVNVPGYSATVLVVVAFSTLNLLSLGLIGNYVFRTYENTKQRPLSLVSGRFEFNDQEQQRP